jgi:hypothetical protein
MQTVAAGSEVTLLADRQSVKAREVETEEPDVGRMLNLIRGVAVGIGSELSGTSLIAL